MRSTCSTSGHRTWTIAAAIISTFAWAGVSGDTAAIAVSPLAVEGAATTAGEPSVSLRPWEAGRTQGGARTTFSLLKDWNLKGENLSPRRHNPLYFPLKPGFKFIMERPDHPDGYYRKEVIVLDKTEPFDLPGIAGIGKFECAVV